MILFNITYIIYDIKHMHIIYSTCDRLYKSRQRAAFTNHGSGFYKSRQRLLQITAAAFTNHGRYLRKHAHHARRSWLFCLEFWVFWGGFVEIWGSKYKSRHQLCDFASFWFRSGSSFGGFGPLRTLHSPLSFPSRSPVPSSFPSPFSL